MLSGNLYKGAAVFASVTGIGAAVVAAKLPIQSGKTGPFNYHRALKPARRIGESRIWRRLPKAI